MNLALVLGGGGVAGVAWETGLLLGVQDESPEAADRLLTHGYSQPSDIDVAQLTHLGASWCSL
jgi:hypothetical protein